MRVTHELAIQIITDIEQCRSAEEGNSIEILCDNPDPDTGEDAACVVAFADFTDWEQVRFFGPTWPAALRKAADASRAFAAKSKTKAVAG
jgi:hypothetical protein